MANGVRVDNSRRCPLSDCVRNLYRSQSVQRLQELQILQDLRKRGRNMRSVQATSVAGAALLFCATSGLAQKLYVTEWMYESCFGTTSENRQMGV